jgi:hypothetical protein
MGLYTYIYYTTRVTQSELACLLTFSKVSSLSVFVDHQNMSISANVNNSTNTQCYALRVHSLLYTTHRAVKPTKQSSFRGQQESNMSAAAK